MLYYSTNRTSPTVDFRQATINGQAPDKGLYFPETIPVLKNDFIKGLKTFSKDEIAFNVMQPYVGELIPASELADITSSAVNFDFPLVSITDDISTLELFHGPTLAFKDVGARFMSRCLGYFARSLNTRVTVLVATSGDTGGAVAAGFAGVEGVDVIILYPSGKVSKVQELQLTTWGRNITALEVEGNFDDCQRLVKQAFTDADVAKRRFLTSANSINVARWLPQQLYYFFAAQQWQSEHPPVIAVPSGNFGNICAGLLANKSGLPVQHFIAACNANDSVSGYLQTGVYEPRQAVPTISNAMDVGHPSNFVRILELFDQQHKSLAQMLSSYSITDDQTRAIIATVHREQSYLLDPHGAVGYIALQDYLQKHPGSKGFFLETAHPVKFYDVVEPVIKSTIPLPDAISALTGKPKQATEISADYEAFRAYLMA